MATKEVKCGRCGCSSLDRILGDWDDYKNLCGACSYNEHCKEDAEEWAETLDLVQNEIEAIQQRNGEESRLEFVASVRRAALELFVEADDEDDEDVTSRERRLAARLAANLAKLLILGAPTPVIEHELATLQKRVAAALTNR